MGKYNTLKSSFLYQFPLTETAIELKGLFYESDITIPSNIDYHFSSSKEQLIKSYQLE